MHTIDGAVVYSATDLLTWRGCAHASRLDALALTDAELRAWRDAQKRLAADAGSGFPPPANLRGDEHEQAMLDRLISEGRSVVDIPRPSGSHGLPAAARATERALRDGVDVVYQAALVDGPWFGYADFLVRVDGAPSALGDWSYEVRDTKLARRPSAGALLQMAHYGAILEQLQGAPPPRLVVWLGTGEEFSWPYGDALPYLEELRARFLAFHAAPPETVADPVDACEGCTWSVRCDEEWGPEDLRHVHRLTRRQRALLREAGIRTVADLARASDQARPGAIGEATFARLRGQAAAQAGADPFVLIRPQPRDAGVVGTPAPHPLDIYFDLEGDPFAALPTLDYLWAFCGADQRYEHRWAHDVEQEREAFLWFLDELRKREAQGGEWRVYHYNSYEVTALTRIAEAWPNPEEGARLLAEVQHLVETRFDDLYRRVESALRVQGGSTSLKYVEKLAGYDRSGVAASVARADESIEAYEAYLRATDEDERAELLDGIRSYNEHDVKATRAVHLWLRGLASALADGDLLDEVEDEWTPSDDVLRRIESTAELQSRLRAAATTAEAAGRPLPSGVSVTGARMLAELLEWHRREFVVAYQDHRRLKEWAAGADGQDLADAPAVPPQWAELNGEPAPVTRVRRGTEHESCLVDVVAGRVHPPVTGRKNEALLREYRCRPGAWKLRAGDRVVEAVPSGDDGKAVTLELQDFDAAAGTFTVKRGKTPPPGPYVATPFIDPPVVWESLMRLGESALLAEPEPPAVTGLRLLDRELPIAAGVMGPLPGEEAGDRARRLLGELTGGVLPVQGPPGTGKTWLAARLVLDEIDRAAARGEAASIGVVANSHRVIDHLLEGIAELVADRGMDVGVAHIGKPEQVSAAGVACLTDGGKALAPWLVDQRAAGRPAVLGATKFGWARADAARCLDLLVVDEAGQVSLADALAVVQASARAVALGDPQQLASPIQASHDELVEVSLLEHLAHGAPVLPDHVGVFLDVTRRMHPAVCDVVGTLAYEGALTAHSTAAARSLVGPDLVVAGHRVPLEPGVVWLPTDADEVAQADVAAGLVRLLTERARVTDGTSTTRLTSDDILVVAPHNAHVNRIRAALAAVVPDARPEDRVGTVDKFQGREAHVVVFAQGRPAEEPGDVPFLYEVNRINVALSRARLLAIVVAHPDAVFPPVSTPDHLRLASRFVAAVHDRRAAPVEASGRDR
ncbi:TM0106 family RecB-like putative nuclease [Blastococcus sp. CCUG 61487]|uniref:TM0106 family RecB-like putative nuclease n=1 Tax=Blastococcus sp. CCUG 61487 TaxID=1840703 RepID=UPI0010C0D761|nr:TM0106 family RecB-like putative nuclease [Blastococcus sp. CCUG 61487]TKJ27865.1 hypothetical protein A6V29_03235 [Blastococcus sp. CCUG 61487]